MIKLIITFFILSESLAVLSQDQWVIKDSINGAPKSAASAFSIGGEGFLLAGIDDDGFRRKVYSYKYSIDDWDDEGSIGGANGSGLGRGSATAFSIGTKGYICLGQGDTNPFFTDLWELDSQTGSWSQKADFIGSPRRSAIGFSINDQAYVGTGIDASGFKKDMYKYDAPNNSWVQIANFGGTARKEAVGFSMGYQGYIGTGDDGVLKKDFWQYESTNDTWTQMPDFPSTSRKGAVGWGIFPQAYICSGEDSNFEFKKDLWEFNFYTQTWTQRADYLGAGRSNAIAFVLEGVAFVGSGYNGDFLDDLYAYRRILNIDEENSHLKTTIFPNPSDDQMTITGDFKKEEMNLFSIAGKNVTNLIDLEQSSQGLKFHKNELPSGSYQVRCVRNDVIYSSTIVFK